MGFVQDNLIPFFKKRTLHLVEYRKESEDVYTFVFKMEEGVAWKAGQYGLFTITHKSVKNGTRPFSVSSAPAEGVIGLTTRIGNQPSAFKQALLELTPGMTILMRGPVGPFYLVDDSPTLLVAGGIGITPFRSILKQLDAARRDGGKLQLLYLDGNQEYIFKDELDDIAERISTGVTYVNSREQLQGEILKFSELNGSGKYYIAGPKSMVESVTAYLQSNQVSKANIKKDVFIGY